MCLKCPNYTLFCIIWPQCRIKCKKREVKERNIEKSSATWQLLQHWSCVMHESVFISNPQCPLWMNVAVPSPVCSLWVLMVTEPVVHVSPLSLFQWEWCSPRWASSLPPECSWSRAVLHCCVWPVGASPQTGSLAGRWGAAAGLGGRQTARGSWGKTAATAGAAPWASLRTSGGRRAPWAVRPVRMAARLSLKAWILASVQSREAPAWKSCRIQTSSDTSALYLSVWGSAAAWMLYINITRLWPISAALWFLPLAWIHHTLNI